MILRNSLIIIVRYMMAQKSDEVRREHHVTHLYHPAKKILAKIPFAGVSVRHIGKREKKWTHKAAAG